MPKRASLGLALLAATLVAGVPADAGDSPILAAMRSELDRSMKALAEAPEPPYFLSYELTESHYIVVAGSFGTLQQSEESRRRQLDVDLRVGSYELDNSRQIRGTRGFERRDRFAYIPMPVDDDPEVLRDLLWYHTDERYKKAVARFTRVETDVQVRVEQEDSSADFSRSAEMNWNAKRSTVR